MRGKAQRKKWCVIRARITPAYAGKSFLSTSRAFCNQDHPRLCGEKQIVIFHFRFLRGSPPPMRGKVNHKSARSIGHRITPAYAGKRGQLSDSVAGQWDHPRLCGEKQWHMEVYAICDRITPAYAGKRRKLSRLLIFSSDHPRLCGEKGFRDFYKIVGKGSPPPMRGKAQPFSLHFTSRRITPAYAGKSAAVKLQLITRQDHPRLCGEKVRLHAAAFADSGSPPPMRGKEYIDTEKLFEQGITPAYAGKSKAVIDFLGFFGDHPRLCGEKLYMPLWVPPRAGSPPPMRGKVRYFGLLTNHKGITPAYAGKRNPTFRRSRNGWDHPRLCGEKPAFSSLVRFQPGSPPPMRGKVKHP